MNRLHTIVSPMDSSPEECECDAGAESIPGVELLLLVRRNFRRTKRGVRIIPFQAAYRSFFFKDRIRRVGFRVGESSLADGVTCSMKALCPSHVTLLPQRRATHQGVWSRKSCNEGEGRTVPSGLSTFMSSSLLELALEVFPPLIGRQVGESIQSTPTSMKGTTA